MEQLLLSTSLELAYAWLEERLAGRTWAAGEDFTLAARPYRPNFPLGAPDRD